MVTDGPNVACGVNKEQIVKVKPSIIEGNVSRLGAGDAFFAYFLSYKELNPDASIKESLSAANEKTKAFLKNK